MGWGARVGAALALGALAGCAGSRGFERGAGMQAAAADGIPLSANVMVLRGPQLGLQQGATVLDAIRAHLPGIQVAEQANGCPTVGIRGPNTAPGFTDPKVYVDGTATAGTCALDDFQAADVARVEVYPLGFTTRPGYATNAHGLILIFTKRANDEAPDSSRQP